MGQKLVSNLRRANPYMRLAHDGCAVDVVVQGRPLGNLEPRTVRIYVVNAADEGEAYTYEISCGGRGTGEWPLSYPMDHPIPFRSYDPSIHTL